MSSREQQSYDFIIAGAGPAGCMLAKRLTASAARPTVLVLEAGGDNSDTNGRIDGYRYVQQTDPEKNWEDFTIPQKYLNGRQLAMKRGKGLGGGSAINFTTWATGPRDDYGTHPYSHILEVNKDTDHIADLVQDDGWKWQKVQATFKKLENYHSSDIYQHRLKARDEDHGYGGDLNIGFPKRVEKELIDLIDAALDHEIPVCTDQNSGNPIGVGLSAFTARDGRRIMSSDLLEPQPSSLVILTQSSVSRVLFDGNRAVGVQSADGGEFFAEKEVILCAGPLADPKVLMHSGIGPRKTLQEFNIPIVQVNENVGQHLQDHQLAVFSWARAEHTSQRLAWFRDTERQAAARQQWEKDGTGDLAEVGTSLALAYPKLDRILDSDEFAGLSKRTQDFLKLETVPHWELALGVPSLEYLFNASTASTMTSMFTFLMNGQSKGSVTIQSADPKEAIVIDLNFLSHPFDRRMAIEVTREVLSLAASPSFAKDTVAPVTVPKSNSEEDIIEFWAEKSMSGSHPMGTCRMGMDEGDSVVDKDFQVFGIRGLRICSTSVLPMLPNCHLQSTAYLVGLMLSDKLSSQYNLDEI